MKIQFVLPLAWLVLTSMMLQAQTVSLSDKEVTINSSAGNGVIFDGNTLSYNIGQVSAPTLIRPDQSYEIGFMHCIACKKIVSNSIPLSQENEIQVYPNPADSWVILASDYQRPVTFQLINMTGQVLQSGELQKEKKVDLKTLATGLYTFVFFDKRGEILFWEKIAKQ